MRGVRARRTFRPTTAIRHRNPDDEPKKDTRREREKDRLAKARKRKVGRGRPRQGKKSKWRGINLTKDKQQRYTVPVKYLTANAGGRERERTDKRKTTRHEWHAVLVSEPVDLISLPPKKTRGESAANRTAVRDRSKVTSCRSVCKTSVCLTGPRVAAGGMGVSR